MAISIADSPGCFPTPPLPFTSMPDGRKSSQSRHSVWQRFWLPKWLVGDGRRSPSPLRFKRREWKLPGERNHGSVDISFQQPSSSASSSAAAGIPHLLHPDRYRDARRAVSADRRTPREVYRSRSLGRVSTSRLSAPDPQWDTNGAVDTPGHFLEQYPLPDADNLDAATYNESLSVNGEELRDILEAELEKQWILNLTLRFRNGCDREKFFVTYAETPTRWRKVTVTCDYGIAEPGSLEQDLKELPYQSDKNARIYESIRDSISQINFFDTVTNLQLRTKDGQLHVNVREDASEIIPYPPVSTIRPLGLLHVRESELAFEAHFSGFAYHVKYGGQDLVKKEISGPESVDEFLYEINALYELLGAQHVIQLKAIVVDDAQQVVKGLLLDFAEKGDLAGLLQDYEGQLPWTERERWAKQIVSGLAEIHEAGFVQGDLTLTNVVVDANDDAKIIDINRRGCPVGWEPPEFKQKLENKQRISMYIGVKSDIYQLGMILWALAMEVDQPERQESPLTIPSHVRLPGYYRDLVKICLSEKPRDRLSAKELLAVFPQEPEPSSFTLQTDGQDDGVLDSFHTPLQNGTVHLDQIPRSHLDQHPDDFPTVSGLEYPPNEDYSLPRFSSSYYPSGLNIYPQDLLPNDEGGWFRHEDAFQSRSGIGLPNADETAGGSLAMAVGSTEAGRDAHPVAVSAAESSTLAFKAQGIDLEMPYGGIPYTDAPETSGSGAPLTLGPYPEALTHVGSHPSCSLDTPPMKADGDGGLPPQPNGSDTPSHASQKSSSHSDIFELAKETRDSEVNTPFDREDLFSSSLPINPTFGWDFPVEMAYDSVQSDFGLGGHDMGPRASNPPQLRRVSSMADLNDLFTSHLPINPRLEEIDHWSGFLQRQPPPSLAQPSASTVEPNPATLSGPDLAHDTDASVSVNGQLDAEVDSLFASVLPINPARHETTVDFDRGCPANRTSSHVGDSLTPVSAVKSAIHVEAMDSTPDSPTENTNTIPAPTQGTSFQVPEPVEFTEILFNSNLPINPAFKHMEEAYPFERPWKPAFNSQA